MFTRAHQPTVPTFHVVQSVTQHLECGHVEGVAECGVVQISAGVGLGGAEAHGHSTETLPWPFTGTRASDPVGDSARKWNRGSPRSTP